MTAVVVGTTKRGRSKIEVDGYYYVKQKELVNCTSYECERRRGSGDRLDQGVCKARVKIGHDMRVVGFVNDHSHEPSVVRGEIIAKMTEIKTKATTSNDTPQQILGATMTDLSQAAAVQMTDLTNIRRIIRRTRQEATIKHPIPTDKTFDIPLDYTRLANGEDFLLHDSGRDDRNRFLIFGTNRWTDLLRESTHLFMDGTFKVVPEIFFQLYTIHCRIQTSLLPCLYVLLPNKTQETYTRLFQVLRTMQPDFAPLTITMDFEKAAINAANTVFPNVQIQGCFFHLAQAIYRKV